MLDKYLAQEFKSIRREFSIIEAMFSYALDKDNGKNGSISGYSKLWNWSRWRVRKFIETIHSATGHYPDRRQTHSRHPIHFIDKGLWDKPDSIPTVSRQYPDTTTNPNPNKEIYNRVIVYLNKKTGKAFKVSSKKTKSLIDSRLNDGCKPEDFKTVIDNKVSCYHSGTFDFKYLRPETLFGTKFESYLNESAEPVNGTDEWTPPPTDEELKKIEQGFLS